MSRTAVLVAAVTSRKARDRFVRTDDLKNALRPSQVAPGDLRFTIGGPQRTPFSSARALRMSAEGSAEPQPQR